MATINYNSGNINVSFFPTNVNPIWFCDKNSGGINIATNGATIAANTLQLGNAGTTTIVNGIMKSSNLDSTTIGANLELGKTQTTGTITIGDSNTRTGPIYLGNNTAGFIAVGCAMTGANFITMGTVTNTSTQIRGKTIEIGDNGGAVIVGNSGTTTTVNGTLKTNKIDTTVADTQLDIGSNQTSAVLTIGDNALRTGTIYMGNNIAGDIAVGFSQRSGYMYLGNTSTTGSYVRGSIINIGDTTTTGNINIGTGQTTGITYIGNSATQVFTSGKVVMNGDGNVAGKQGSLSIGSSNVNAMLNVASTGNSLTTQIACRPSSDTVNIMDFYNVAGTNRGSIVGESATSIALNTTGYIGFKKNNVEKWRISDSGNLKQSGSFTDSAGINLPTGGCGLHWGDGFSRIVDDGDLQICTDDSLHIKTGGTTVASCTSRIFIEGKGGSTHGYVGVGNVAPGYKLDVTGDLRVTGTTENQIGNWKIASDYIGTNAGSTNFVLYQKDGDTVINTAGANGTISFKKANNPTMIIDSNGNLGVGTIAPAYALDVNGDARIQGGNLYVGNNNDNTFGGRIYFGGTYGDNAYDHSQIVTRQYSVGGQSSELLIFKANDGDDRIRLRANLIQFDTQSSGSTDVSLESIRMTITSNGYVGIGTTTPEFPLHVNIFKNSILAYSNIVPTPGGGLYAGGSGTTADFPVSIRAAKSVWAEHAVAVSSDRRIKTNIVDVNDDSALTLFRKLQPKTYQYKDKISRGTETVYGFIAQEVYEILPTAVMMLADYIPNIYVPSTVNGDTLTFDTTKLEYDASGQLFPNIRLIKTDDIFVKIIRIVDDNTVQIDQTLAEGKVFVYGQKVNNFHTLNKDAIWTVAAAALQEVDRQLQAEKEKTVVLEQKCVTLEQKCVTLEQKYDILQSNYEALLTRIVAIESKG